MIAFGFGVLSLAISGGAGSGAQRVIGTSVLGGMLVSTLFVGILVGSFGFCFLSEFMIHILIGVIVVAFCLINWIKPQVKGKRQSDKFNPLHLARPV